MTTLCGVSHLRRSGIPFAYGTQPSRAGLTCVAPPALRKPIEEFVPEAGGGEEPGAAVVEAEGSAGEGDGDEGIIVAAAENRLRDFVAEIGGHADAVAGVAEGEVEAVELAGVGHDVEGKIESASPDVRDCCGLQLRIDAEHSLPQDLGAAADGAGGFRGKSGAGAGGHAAGGGGGGVWPKYFWIPELS